MLPIKNPTRENFKKYGTLIDFTEDQGGPDFQIVIRHEEDPWRIAVLRVKERGFTELERHPRSYETFEPMEGMTLLLLSLGTDPAEYEVFLLDRPVCLNKGVWHGIVTLTEEAKVKITENLMVETEFHKFQRPMEVRVD